MTPYARPRTMPFQLLHSHRIKQKLRDIFKCYKICSSIDWLISKSNSQLVDMAGRYRRIIAVSFCLIISLCQMYANTCDQMEIDVLDFKHDKAVVGFTFFTIRRTSVFMCAKLCLYRKKCKSLDYETETELCSLKTTSSLQESLREQPGTIHLDQSTIPQVC